MIITRLLRFSILMLIASWQTAPAATISVAPSLVAAADDGQCALIEAIKNANDDRQTFANPGECAAGTGADTIELGGGPYLLTDFADLSDGLNALPSITGVLTIQGNDATLQRDFEGLDLRFFHIAESGTLTLTGVWLKNGSAVGGSAASSGGCLLNKGKLVLSHSTLSGCSAAWGGGLFNAGSAELDNTMLTSNQATKGAGLANTGTLILRHCTLEANLAKSYGGGLLNERGSATLHGGKISGNSADAGGGLNNNGTLILNAVMLSGNHADSEGGGLLNRGELTVYDSELRANTANNYGGGVANNDGTATVSNSTIADNSATAGGGVRNRSALILSNSTLSGNKGEKYAGGLLNEGTANLNNSTLASNAASYGSGLFNHNGTANLVNTIVAYGLNGSNCYGPLAVNSNNLFSDSSCDGVADIDINLDAELKDNGGSTPTHALRLGSAAIDAGLDCAGPPVNGQDQRGVKRSARCDIGAIEASQ